MQFLYFKRMQINIGGYTKGRQGFSFLSETTAGYSKGRQGLRSTLPNQAVQFDRHFQISSANLVSGVLQYTRLYV